MKRTYIVILLSLFSTSGFCQNDQQSKINNQQDIIISLDSMPDNFVYTELVLEGIQWKLVGFVDMKENQIRLVKLGNRDKCYIFCLDNNKLKGKTYSNSFSGNYEIDTVGKKIIYSDIGITEAKEYYDGKEYFEQIQQNCFYKISPKGLYLYSSNNYISLLFIPLIN